MKKLPGHIIEERSPGRFFFEEEMDGVDDGSFAFGGNLLVCQEKEQGL